MNYKNKFHRFTTGLLCLIVVLTMMMSNMPLTAFAAEDKSISIYLSEKGIPTQSSGDGWTCDEKPIQVTIEKGYSLNNVLCGEDQGILGCKVVNYGTIALKKGCCSSMINKSGGVIQFHESGNEMQSMSSVENEGVISGGFFSEKGSVENHGTIEGGVFEGSVKNYGTIRGGVFFGKVENYSSIDGGYFLEEVTNIDDGTLDAPTKQTSAYSLRVENRCGAAQITHTDESLRENLKNYDGNKRGIAGAVYQVKNTADLIGLYLLGEDDKIPQAPYSITSDFRPGLLNLYYEFTMPSEDTTVYAVYKGYCDELTVDGAIEEAFNFEKDDNSRTYNFDIQNPPAGLTDYSWSVEGTLPAGLSLMDSKTSNAYIGGTPTKITDKPVSLTVSVRATAANGDVCYGKTDILVSVYEPENPFVEAEILLKTVDCTVPMGTANTEETVSAWLKNTWLPGITNLELTLGEGDGISELSVVTGENFIAATEGTASDTDGTDGSVTFSVECKGEHVCEGLTCKIKATAYNHTHSFSDAYSYDSTYHWYKCMDPKCNEVIKKVLHSGTDDGDCTTAVVCECGFCSLEAEDNHDFTGEYKYNESGHWHVCKNRGCVVTDTVVAHSGGTATYTTRAICEACGQSYGTTTADITPPTGSIKVGTHTWSSLQSNITFTRFFKEKQTVTVTANDTESGVMKTEYILSDKQIDNFTTVTWTKYTESFHITEDDNYIIYVKITDNEGNFVIISSDGIVIDKTAPLISGIENGKTYCLGVFVRVNEKLLDFIMLNGNKVTLTDSRFTVGPSAREQTITAIDSAGNSTTYTITVNNEHTWVTGNSEESKVCSVCNRINKEESNDYVEPQKESYDYVELQREFYDEKSDSTQIYGDQKNTHNTFGISGGDLSKDDKLIIESNPPGNAYDDLLKLADGYDVIATYNIYLKSGKKNLDSKAVLRIKISLENAGQDFTLVHRKADDTYEYFYDTADKNGDLSFGPLYELSPFMLVKGTLISSQESDSDSPQTGDNSNPWLWRTLLLVSGGAITLNGIIWKRRRETTK